MAQMTEINVIGTEIERVSPDVVTLFERDNTFFSQIEKRPVEVVSGRDLRVPIELRPGGKTRSFNPDGGDMGRGGGPQYDKALINTVDKLHAIEWSVKTEWVTDDRRKAVINAFRDLMAKSMKEFRRNIDSLAMTGGDGVLGTITSRTANTPTGFDTFVLNSDGFGARLVRFGNDIAVYSADLLTARNA